MSHFPRLILIEIILIRNLSFFDIIFAILNQIYRLEEKFMEKLLYLLPSINMTIYFQVLFVC